MGKCLFGLIFGALLLAACGRHDVMSLPLDIDISNEFAGIQNQLSSDFCQSFAFAGLLEHIWFQKTGNILKLSEKSIIRAALRTLIETYWNERDHKFDPVPFDFHIGDVGTSLLSRAVASYGVVPEDAYPTLKADSQGNKAFTFDLKAYAGLFERTSAEMNSSGITRDTLLNAVDELMGVPGEFTTIARTFSYETFKYVEHAIGTPAAMRDFLEFHADDYVVVYSAEGFVAGQNIFNPENHRLLVESERRFTQTPVEASASHLLDTIEKMLDQGIPVVMWKFMPSYGPLRLS